MHNETPKRFKKMRFRQNLTTTRGTRSLRSFFLTFVIMFSLWVVLSGFFDAFHLGLGVIASALVAYFSGDMLFPSPKGNNLFLSWARFLRYIPWLLYQIFLSNIHLMRLTFHPRMMELIDPQIIRFRTKLKSDLALVTFANSITLTPGTITINISADGIFTVHVIDRISAEGLPGEMEKRVARAFGEE